MVGQIRVASVPGAGPTAMAVALVMAATLGGAWAFQYWGDLAPCHLCLLQRWPYYIGVPLALAVAAAVGLDATPALVRLGLALLALVLLASAVMGVYHAGVEWQWWPGPADCTATGAATTIRSGGNMLDAMRTTRVTPCNEAAWRFLGTLSLAGFNAVISAVLLLAVASVVTRPAVLVRA